MSRLLNEEILKGCIEEVESYIPQLTQGINSLKKNPKPKAILEELHRLVHTIKGASSIVGISGLSRIAFEMEDALEDVMAKKLKLSAPLFQAMTDTVNRFQIYCTDYLGKGVYTQKLLTETVQTFRRIKQLPQNQDAEIIKQILDILPEWEGGKGEPEKKEIEADKPVEEAPLIWGEPADAIEDGEAPLFIDKEAPKSLSSFPEDLPAELIESFHAEAEEHLEDLYQSLQVLEAKITRRTPIMDSQKEEFRRIRRSVHTLKGASAVIGFPIIAAFAHELEDLLDWLYESATDIDPSTIKTLIESADLLETLVKSPHLDQSGKSKSLKAKYHRIMDREGDAEQTEFTGQQAQKDSLTPEPPVEEPPSPMQIHPELLESFHLEAEEHLEVLNRALNLLESQIVIPTELKGPQHELIRQVRRSVHTIKGASAVIGLTGISKFAHVFEDLLDWLYETTREVTPRTIRVLIDSADVLDSFVHDPQQDQRDKISALKIQYDEIIGEVQVPHHIEIEKDEEKPVVPESKKAPEREDAHEPDEAESDRMVDEESEMAQTAEPAFQTTRTLRVRMERVDELVNLTGELIIALSGFDQKMEDFRMAISELELSRDRVRDIAKDMELSYEVKALEQMRRSEFTDFDALELDRYSQLNLIIRSLNEAVIDVGAIHTRMSNLHSDFDGNLNRERVLLSELQNKMMRVRMTPMSVIVNKLRRTVRDLAGKLGKKIRLIIEGQDIELDRLVWEKLTDPLMHLLRNAADHGIEPPALRQVTGKPPVGLIKLIASREGNQVVIRIHDDGSGLNYKAIRETARQKGLSDRIEEMTDEEVSVFIFQPGFSTRGKISEVSGRGVGMDVVKENIQALKGTIRISSQKDKGTRFTIRIPLTLAAVRALLFTVRGQLFAIALGEIKEIVRIDPGQIITRPEESVRIKDELLPLLYLRKILNIHAHEGAPETGTITLKGTKEHPLILVVEAGGQRGAVVIDNLAGQREIVIKSTGTHLQYVRGISGATIMGDGSVVPILNVEELLQMKIKTETITLMEAIATEKPLEIMVVDDSVSIRQVVSRLLEDQGWKVFTAKDGIDALEQLRDRKPDMIILDIEMPRMNGYEFLSAIRSQPAYSEIPVAMLTSRTALKHRQKAISLGAKGFIVKPYNDEEFVDLVIKLTGKH